MRNIISQNKFKTNLLIFSFLGLLSCKKILNNPVISAENESVIIFGVNAYSFADLLQAKDFRDQEQVYTLFNLLDWCDYKGVQALDPTGYFFPTYPEVPSDDYITTFKNKADALGIAISGAGIRNNFASPDPKVRADGVALAKEWIVVASKLGAPVLRVFAGGIPEGYENNWKEPACWMIDCYNELLPTAEAFGVKIGIQNHGEMLQTAAQCLYVLKQLNSKWADIIVDTGNFTTDDPYKDIAMLVPYAINWQVKEYIDGYGGKVPIDYKKLVKIITDGGYKGIVPVETLKVKGEFYDPFYRVENMLDLLRKELETEEIAEQ
ncbi:sugar phosphate isomerase/epimerase family protein [Aestuariivivens sediminis]|uniref:sugar phosphate isomerase/epimerase family protein n=1 Tax=Aestuariivivens sediminis TaxID=2913557 RepID=UPI001F571F55|nr:sugar phosphate isomerase/epimerase family protein [Aestuariivivens sediminis]